MKKIVISADSTCDLSPELIERYNIKIIPLLVRLGDNEFKDGITVHPTDIFKFVAETGNLPKTAALSIGDYVEFFKELRKEYDEIIHINISAEFSSCFNNATLAAQEVGGVYAVDSRNLSTGSGHIVLSAAALAEEGKLTAAEIAEEMNKLTPKIDASFVINNIDYLYKGGRCSGVAAVGANLLKLKPLIEVKDGKMGMAGKYRGNYKDVIKKYVNDRLSKPDANIKKDHIFITSTCTDNVLPDIAQAEVEKYGFKNITRTTAGCTITCHCGPDTLGILYIHN